MGLMDSVDVQYIWKAIQESERSDGNLYPNTTLSEGLFQAYHSASSFPAHCAGDALGEHATQPQAERRREPERGEEQTPSADAVPPEGFALLPPRQNRMPLRRPEGRPVDG